MSFTIEASEKAFAILSGGIYSNTKRAVVRELSCNAYDSHVDAGHPERPFDIVLPTKLTPYFEIRDYGTGMSDDDVRHLYTTYFSSTKTGSNDFIGALGLGSKSPFSYADSFVIVSYFNGKASSYLAFKDGKGRPQITNTGSIDTEEENGIRIKVPVQAGDFGYFKSEAEYVFQTFEVKPNFIGLEANCDMPKGLKIDDTGYFSSGWGSSFYAIQGNVRYRIDNDKIPRWFYRAVSGDAFLYFNIGELGVAASREELAYDEGNTEQAIKDKVELVKAGFIDYINKELELMKTPHEAGKRFNEIIKDSSIDGSVVKDEIVWNGIDIQQFADRNHTVKLKRNCFYSAKDNFGSETLTIKKYHHPAFSCHDDLAVVIDVKTNFRRRIREYCHENNVRMSNMVIIKDRVASTKAWSKVLKGMPVMLVSEMPEIKKEYKRSTPTKKSAPVYDNNMIESSVDIDDVKYYVEINRWEVISQHGHHQLESYAIAWHNVLHD